MRGGRGARQQAGEGLTKVNRSPNFFHSFVTFLFNTWGNKANAINLIYPTKIAELLILHWLAKEERRGMGAGGGQ